MPPESSADWAWLAEPKERQDAPASPQEPRLTRQLPAAEACCLAPRQWTVEKVELDARVAAQVGTALPPVSATAAMAAPV
jgi:hypothetical protein